MPPPLPLTPYWLQVSAGLACAAATSIVDCLHARGISHDGASSCVKTVPGGADGPDVADAARLNPDIGGERTDATWIDALGAHAMAHLIVGCRAAQSGRRAPALTQRITLQGH